MRIDIKGVHYELTDVTREFIDAKVEKIRRHGEDLVTDLLLTLHREPKETWRTEAQLIFRVGTTAHVEETAWNLHEALEKLLDRLDVKVGKEKERIQDHHKA